MSIASEILKISNRKKAHKVLWDKSISLKISMDNNIMDYGFIDKSVIRNKNGELSEIGAAK